MCNFSQFLYPFHVLLELKLPLDENINSLFFFTFLSSPPFSSAFNRSFSAFFTSCWLLRFLFRFPIFAFSIWFRLLFSDILLPFSYEHCFIETLLANHCHLFSKFSFHVRSFLLMPFAFFSSPFILSSFVRAKCLSDDL